MRRALLLALLLLVPLAGADHAFSHRVYVVGRVLDAEGRPAPGLPVELAFEGLRAGGACAIHARSETTGPRGDYELCRHAHALDSRGNVSVHVQVEGAQAHVALEPDLRHAVANLRLDAPRRAQDVAGDRLFERTLTVTGRHFALLPEPETAESVAVNATPVLGNLTVALFAGGVAVAEARGATDEDGLYRIDLNVTDIPAGAIVRVEGGPDVAEESPLVAHRRADVNLVRDLRLREGPGDDAPGSTPLPLAPWLALGAILTAAAWRAPRRR